MKRKFLIILTLILSLVLIGCQGKKDLFDDDDTVTLTYYVWGNNQEVDAIKDVIADFELENPKIKIRIERAGSDYFNDLKLKFSSGRGPDIFLMDPGEILPFLKEDYLLPLDSYIASSDNLSLTDLWEVNDGYRFNGSKMGSGKLYALIKDWSPDFMLIYNKNHVEEYRIKNPGAFPYLEEGRALTWSEFNELAEKLTIGSGTTISRNGTTMDFVPFKHLFEWVQMTGDTLFINDDQNFNKNGIGVKKAFEQFISLHEGPNAPFPYKGSSSLAVGGERFTLGNVSTVFLGRWAFVAYDWYNVDFEIGILPPPVPDNRVDANGNTIPYAGVSGMIANSINKDTRYPKEAYQFIEYYQTKGMVQLAELGFNIPGNKTVAEDIFLSVADEKILDINQIFIDAAINYSYPIIYNQYLSTTTIENIISRNISLYFERKEGITTVDLLLNKIATEIDREISRIK